MSTPGMHVLGKGKRRQTGTSFHFTTTLNSIARTQPQETSAESLEKKGSKDAWERAKQTGKDEQEKRKERNEGDGANQLVHILYALKT